MDIIVKLSSLAIDSGRAMEENINPDEFQTIIKSTFDAVAEEYKDRAVDPDAYLCEIVEDKNFLFGAQKPDALVERVKDWNQEIQKEFLASVDALCNVSVTHGLPEPSALPLRGPLTYRMKCAAMELNDSWYDYATHAVCLENSQGWLYFHTVLSEAELNNIINHPEEYAIVTVTPKS